MALVKQYPNLPSKWVYTAKEVCGELGISPRSLRRYKSYGWIDQNNEEEAFRPLYSGAAVNKLWLNLTTKAIPR